MSDFPFNPDISLKSLFILLVISASSLANSNLANANDSAVLATAMTADSSLAQTVTPTAIATPATTYTPDTAIIKNSQTTTNTRDQISQIVYADDFSKKTQQKVWKEKHPNDTKPPSWLEKWLEKYFNKQNSTNASNTAASVGLIAKLIALMALLAGVIWIAKNADTWLAWFQGSKRRHAVSPPDADIASHYREAFAPLWQGLPEKSRLSQFVKEAVAKGDWRLALSTLYRGTLREIVDIYDLPITRATTERQSEWLLQKQNATPNEATFFQQLIALWLPVAYGQMQPNPSQVSDFSHTIHTLASTWDSLYLHRSSQLDKRYQQLEQTPIPHTKVKQKKFFTKGGN